MTTAIAYPDRDDIEIFVSILTDNKSKGSSFFRRHLPSFDKHWIDEMISLIEMVQLPGYPQRLHAKAAHIFYKVIKNHKFVDGNKRSAVIVLFLFYVLNDYVLMPRPMSLRYLAKRTAEDKLVQPVRIKNPDIVIRILEAVLEEISTPLKK